MFIHNLKYSFLTLMRNRTLIFWTFAFPIILGTFFNMAFANIESGQELGIIDIAVVNTDEVKNDKIFSEAIKHLSDKKNEDRLFNTKYTALKEAQELLEDKKIIGYLKNENTKKEIIISTNGIEETVFKYVVEEINQTSDIVSNIANKEIEKEMISGNYNIDYEKIYKNVYEMIEKQDVKINNISSKNLSFTMIEFYTLIAMTCLYGGMLGMSAMNENLANMSNNGKRVAVSPTNKMKVVLSSLLAGYITQIIGLLLLFIYTIFILKVNYGDNICLIIVLSLVGSLAGLSMGIAIGSLVKSNDNTKDGILLSITMLGCFFSGMMGVSMKYVIDKNAPIINLLNPASMITDGFYSLYYYDTLNRYIFNIASLLILSSVLLTISFISLRRQKYDSI